MSSVESGFAPTDDGIDLYYRLLGSAPTTIVCCNGVGVSTFFWKYIALHFRDRYQILLWDYRGHGLSSPPRDLATADLSIERNAVDLATVLKHLQIDTPVILLGHSMGCEVILEFYRQYPQSVLALIPMFGTYGKALDTFMGFTWSRTVFELVFWLTKRGDRGMFRLLLPLYASPLAFAFSQRTGMVDRYYSARIDMDHYMDHLERIDPVVFVGMLERMANHDLEWLLPDITVPTLVFGGERDIFTPLHCSRHMAATIPGAELIVLAEASHAAIVEHPDTINLRIERFIRERLPKVAVASAPMEGEA